MYRKNGKQGVIMPIKGLQEGALSVREPFAKMNVLLQVLLLCSIKIIALSGYAKYCTYFDRYTYVEHYVQTYQRWQPYPRRWFWQEHGQFVIDSRYATRTGLGTRTAQKCCFGYAGTYPHCTPNCSTKCVNGECTAPEVCSCSSGYSKSTTYECKPVCSRGCGQNGKCTSPGVCNCNAGFKLEGLNSCVPICESGCPFGRCVAPNTCLCDPGYKMSPTESKSKPICPGGCGENGECTSSGVCTCNAGFKLEGLNSCVPICESGCPFGKCVAPNTCQCDPGYEMSSTDPSCKPVCPGGCGENGACTSPDVCTCFDGFSIDGHNRCTPICDGGCPFGKCIAPNTCECQPDYAHNPSKNKCEPICSQGCDHGFCFRPEICVCDHGYLMGPDNKCEPVCAEDCVNGICSAPDTCACLPGYKMTLNSVSSCEPICEPDCQFSNCAGPGVCLCWSGYIPINETTCQPNCLKECVNGYCGEPNKCTCYEGYKPHLSEENVCAPVCRNCDHGECIAPQLCECLPGYETSQDGLGCSAISTSTEESYLTESSLGEDIIQMTSLSFSMETTTTENYFSTLSTPETISTDLSIDLETTLKLNSEYEANNSAVFSPLDFYHCNCWVLSFATVNASSPATCTPDCNSTNDIDCVNLQMCQVDEGSMELSCNSTFYVCRTDAASTSKVVSTSGWLLWALVAGVLLLLCIIGTGLIVRKYCDRGSALLESPEYAVQYVQG